MKILITGSNGMLGHDLIKVLEENNELILTTSKTFDITDKKQTMDYICDTKPDIVINSAAYTDVDGCEQNQDLAYAVNGDGVRNLALACREIDCPLVHISTDYVFDGSARDPIAEDGEIGPISVYGKSKLKGEEAILEILDKYFIVRTAWLYGINGRNFPKTMLELAQNHSEITVVYDGTYHLTNSGSCSWCEFARYIFEIADKDVKVIPVTASEFARPAPRPSYSVLNNKQWVENGFKPLRNYKEAIKEYIELIKWIKNLF